jgi:hypothetical protein
MYRIKNKINKIYEKLFYMDNHPFFMDLKNVNEYSDEFIEYQKKMIQKKINFQKKNISFIENIKSHKPKELQVSEIKKLDKELSEVNNFKKIFKIVTYISNFVIKTNVTDENELLEKLNHNKHRINILVLGAGPIGLFLACYLHIYYNTSYGLNNQPKVNVVIYDNRIERPGFRKPYNRTRPFGTSSNLLSIVLPKLYSMTKKDYIEININILEYLLFVKAHYKLKIPIIYEDYDWNDYKKIIKKGDFKVVFDCTGGRLKTDLFKNVNTKWLEKVKQIDKSINKQLKIIPKENIVHLIDYPNDKKFKKNHFYGSLNVYDKKLNFITKFDIDIMNSSDLKFISSIKKKYVNLDQLKNVLHNIKDENSRNFFYNLYIFNDTKYKNYIFSFDIWAIYIRHIIQPCEVFKINNKQILYVASGDTVFHSHFVIGAGLNRTINFSVKCANFISDLIE